MDNRLQKKLEKPNFVFISYSHEDKDIVLPIIFEMEKNNVEIWGASSPSVVEV